MLCLKNNLKSFQNLLWFICIKLFDSRLKNFTLDDLIMESAAVFPPAVTGHKNLSEPAAVCCHLNQTDPMTT